MPWVTDQSGNQVWQGDPTAPSTAPLTNPGSTQQPINYPPAVTVAPPPAPAAPAAPSPAAPAATTPAPAATTPTTSIGAPQGVDAQGNPTGQYTVAQILAPFDTEYQQASQAVLDANDRINGRHGAKDANGNPLPDISGSGEGNNAIANPQAYSADLQAYSAAATRLAAANTNRANALNTAIQKQEITPTQVEVAQAQAKAFTAAAAKSDEETQILKDGADSQKQLVIATGAKTVAEAQLAAANAAKAAATTPADVALATSQANQAQAVADTTRQMADVNAKKVAADTTLTQHQVGLTDNQSDYYKSLGAEATPHAAYEDAQTAYQKALVPGAPALQAAQTQQAAGAGAQAQATAQATLESILQKQQGPTYGLQGQLPIVQQVLQNVFHNPANVGKSTDELNSMADDLYRQYTVATLGGTTIGQGAAATATAQQNNFATQMGGVNALQGAMASRANQFAQMGGNVLGTLAGMNYYAPKGSSAGAGAYQAMMDQMAQRLAGPQFAPVQLPQPPPLPTFLQAFAAGHQAGTAQATAQGNGQSPTINVNVNGQPAASSSTPPLPSLLSNYATPPSISALPSTLANTFGDAASNAYNATGVPSMMNNYMPFANATNPMNMIGSIGLRQPGAVQPVQPVGAMGPVQPVGVA